jgi:hypothetical protein
MNWLKRKAREFDKDYDEMMKLYQEFQSLPKRKLIGGKYVVEYEGGYVHTGYVSVEDMETHDSGLAWLKTVFNDNAKTTKDLAEALFIYLDSADKCKNFLDGKVVKIRRDKGEFGSDILFNS